MAGSFAIPTRWDAITTQVTLGLHSVRFPQQFTDTHLHSWVEQDTVRVDGFAQEQNIMTPTRTTRPGFEQASHF